MSERFSGKQRFYTQGKACLLPVTFSLTIGTKLTQNILVLLCM